MSGYNPALLVLEKDSVFGDVKTFWANNAVPLQTIFLDKKWSGPFSPDDTNHLDVVWKAESGVIYHGWRLAVFSRGDLFVKANKDTVEMLHMIETKQPLPAGREFKIDMESNGFTATGIEISRGIALKHGEGRNKLSLGVTARYLHGDRIQDGLVKGTATPIDSKSYNFDLAVDYVYNKNYLYKRKDTIPGSGDGFSFDIGMKYDLSRELSLEILFRDIAGRIYWHNAPFTTADATSNTKFFDDDGYMKFRPSIRGYEFYKDFVQHIPLKADVSLIYSNGPFTITPTLNFIQERPLYWLNIDYKINQDMTINTGGNLNYKILFMGMSYKGISLALFGNIFDPGSATTLGAKISCRYEW